MLRFNAIGNGRFSAFLTRSFWMKTAENAAPTLADEITPTIDVNALDDIAAPFLRGERWANGYNVVSAPGALNYAFVSFVNPPNSGMLCCIDEFGFFTNTVGEIFGEFSLALGAGTTGANRFVSDSRWWAQGAALPAGNVQAFVNTIPPGASTNIPFYQQIAAGLTNIRLARSCRIILRPGTSFTVGHSVVATPSLIVDFAWRERPIAAEELATG